LLTAQYQAGQVALKAQMVRDSARIWAAWRGTSKAEWNRMVALAVPVIRARHSTSAGVSARYFETLSAIETGRRQHGELPPPLDEGVIADSLAATALVSVYHGRQRGMTLAAAKQVGFVRLAGAASRLALAGGRDAVLASVQTSNRAVGYERMTSGQACEFCAGLEGDHSQDEAFPAHDHCACVAQPVFS
jgi:hypothetical protein